MIPDTLDYDERLWWWWKKRVCPAERLVYVYTCVAYNTSSSDLIAYSMFITSSYDIWCFRLVIQIPYNSPISLSRHSSATNMWVSSVFCTHFTPSHALFFLSLTPHYESLHSTSDPRERERESVGGISQNKQVISWLQPSCLMVALAAM